MAQPLGPEYVTAKICMLPAECHGRALTDEAVEQNHVVHHFLWEEGFQAPPSPPGVRPHLEEVVVHNARFAQQRATLAKDGFQLIADASKVKDWSQGGDAEGAWSKDMVDMVKSATGASRAMVLGQALRRDGREKGHAGSAHVEQSAYCEGRLPPPIEEACAGRHFAIYLVWVSTDSQSPVKTCPMGILHPGSVQQGDLVLCQQYSEQLSKKLIEQHLASQGGSTGGDPRRLTGVPYATYRAAAEHLGLNREADKKKAADSSFPASQLNIVQRSAHARHHWWAYYPDMTANEVLVMKQYDTREPRAERQGVVHAAFNDPTAPAGSPPCRSVEIRVVCIFEPDPSAAERRERSQAAMWGAFSARSAVAPPAAAETDLAGDKADISEWFVNKSAEIKQKVEELLRSHGKGAGPPERSCGRTIFQKSSSVCSKLQEQMKYDPSAPQPAWLLQRTTVGAIQKTFKATNGRIEDCGLQIKDKKVESVTDGSFAADAGVKVGWAIHSIGNRPVKSDAECGRLFAKAQEDGGSVSFIFLRPLDKGDKVMGLDQSKPLELFARPEDMKLDVRTDLVENWSLEPGAEAEVEILHARPHCFKLKDPEGRSTHRVAKGAVRLLQYTDGTPVALPVFVMPDNDFRVWHRGQHGIVDSRSYTCTRASEFHDVATTRPPKGMTDPTDLMAEVWKGHVVYGEDNPLQYLVRLLCSTEALKGVRSISPFQNGEADELLGQMQRGEVLLSEVGVAGHGHASVTTKGFWPGEALVAGGASVISIPGGDQKKYNDIVAVCLQYRIGFGVVWEAHFGDSWIFVWLRNVLNFALHGTALLVLTADDGYIGFAQRAEVALLLCLGLPFRMMTIDRFISTRIPLVCAAREKRWQDLEAALAEPHVRGALPHFLLKTCALGMTPLHHAAEKGAPATVFEKLIEAGSDPMQRSAWGRTALHLCAEFKGGPEQASLLVKRSPAAVTLVDDGGYTPLCAALVYSNTAVEEAVKKTNMAPPLTDHEKKYLEQNKKKYDSDQVKDVTSGSAKNGETTDCCCEIM